MESNGTAMTHVDKAGAIEAALVEGDLAKLSPEDRIRHFMQVCETVGLNPATKPFDYFKNKAGKLVLYANKSATDQLRSLRNVNISIVAREDIGGVYVVTARASLPGGRCDESTGAVACGGLKGEDLANSFMKAETKAKRRVTLSICGLGMLDESEVDSIPGATRVPLDAQPVAAMPKVNADSVSVADDDVVDLWRMRFEQADTAEQVAGWSATCKQEVTDRPTLLAISVFANAAKARLGMK